MHSPSMPPRAGFRFLPRRIGTLAAMMATLALPSLPAHAQSRLDAPSAQELIEALAKPMPDGQAPARRTRALIRPDAKLPDATTALCDTPGNALAGTRGAGKTRALYVTDAPKVDLNVRFALDSSKLSADAEQMLDALGQALKSPELRTETFVIAGHTDRQGNGDYNKRLSCERAAAVGDYLAKRHGIARERLVILGFGFDRLLNPDQADDEINRRVEVRRN
ncbi:OmpA family protein [Noviherbaspirillum sedimenti]|uniref:OmpA family protein n=1 Tax=Noviherbaspirillum sedimenti TaxID=2320865 RepID=A0A3A3FXP1_9BURK|nr:OmpA family protein [Noviherbaspirillum sedimenti]RJG00474.1 OmpA family protein [Noviherbaspirillum sedimenti]